MNECTLYIPSNCLHCNSQPGFVHEVCGTIQIPVQEINCVWKPNTLIVNLVLTCFNKVIEISDGDEMKNVTVLSTAIDNGKTIWKESAEIYDLATISDIEGNIRFKDLNIRIESKFVLMVHFYVGWVSEARNILI